MSWLNSYNSGNANTALPITTKSGYCLRYDRYKYSSTSYRFTMAEVSASESNLQYIAASSLSSAGLVRIKVYNPNNKRVYFAKPVAQAASIDFNFQYPVAKIKADGDYEYYYFNITGSVSSYLCPVYFDHTSTSGTSHTYYWYYGLEIVEAIKVPAWDEKKVKIYDDGTSHEIPPTIYCEDNCSTTLGTLSYSTANLPKAYRMWELKSGNTYTVRCSSITNIRILCLNSLNYGSATTAPASSTYTQDSQGYKYTVKLASGNSILLVGYEGTSTSVTIPTLDATVTGKRPAGWYDVDNYAMKTVWKDTTTAENS